VSAPAATVPGRVPLVDAATLAAELGCSAKFVYEHSEMLGAMRLGNGPRARLRFDPLAAREALSCLSSRQPNGANSSAGAEKRPSRRRRSTRMPNGLPPAGSILASRPPRLEVRDAQ
jgi:hypothetical protein